MIDANRIGALMRAGGLTQSELARRVGVTQPTIYKLLNSNKTGSAHLHKIARELGTTPAYLSGETNDPDSDLPDERELDSEERELVACYRELAPTTRSALMHVARSMAANAVPGQHGAGR